jgi:DNA-binding response OmpR family regulator
MRIRALIVEDQGVMRDLLKRFLQVSELAEWEFSEAASGEEALARFNPRKTDIVFLDWTLTAMSGTEVAMAIRARADAQHVALVMVTGRSKVGDIEIALDQVGVDEYITKPFTLEMLKLRLRKVIDKLAQRRDR